jgi:hypothetical protein
MLQAFFDESERPDGLFTVAGVAFRKSQAMRAKIEWLNLFRDHGMLHMRELCHGRGRFEGVPRAERDRMLKGAVDIVNRHAMFRVSVTCHAAEMAAVLPTHLSGFEGAYTVCAHLAMIQLGELAGAPRRIAFMFEAGHSMGGKLDRFIAMLMRNGAADTYSYVSHSFVTKDAMPLVQSADLFAWEVAKYWDETATKRKRLMRRSLVSLVTAGELDPDRFDTKRTRFAFVTGDRLAQYAADVAAIGLVE